MIRLDAGVKPMCLVAIDQGLVDDLTRIVIHIAGAFNVTVDEIPDGERNLKVLFAQCLDSVEQ